jgi:hypothetical protein
MNVGVSECCEIEGVVEWWKADGSCDMQIAHENVWTKQADDLDRAPLSDQVRLHARRAATHVCTCRVRPYTRTHVCTVRVLP